MTPNEKQFQQALGSERAAVYKKRRKEALKQVHINLCPIDTEASATLSPQPAQECGGHAMTAQSCSSVAVQASNAAAAPQVVPSSTITSSNYVISPWQRYNGASSFIQFSGFYTIPFVLLSAQSQCSAVPRRHHVCNILNISSCSGYNQ